MGPVGGGPLAIDAALAALAARHRGIVTAAQARAAGVSAGAVSRRVASGVLHPIHRGVYLFGHPTPPPLALETAALAACGDGAVLSHGTAAWLWELRPRPAGPVAITVATSGGRTRTGLLVHRTRSLDDRDLTRRHGLPLTAPPRTILDLAPDVSARDLERAVDEAQVRRLAAPPTLRAVIARTPGHHGCAPLARVLDGLTGPTLTRSQAEERLLALIRQAGLPQPQTNVRVGRHEVDVLWPAQRLVVEVDGFAYHSSRAAFERDRLRDAELLAAGLRVIRVTWRQLADDSLAVVARLAQALVVQP